MSGVAGAEARRRWRRRLVIAGLLPLLLALLLAGKVSSMLVLNAVGRATYSDGELTAAERAFGATSHLNWFEPWVAHFDHGTALYGSGRPREAALAFDRSLGLVPLAHECRVRVNLALSWEAVGDTTVPDGARATEAWDRARLALAGSDCAGSRVETIQDRLNEKSRTGGDARAEQERRARGAELVRRNDAAADERRRAEQRRRDRETVRERAREQQTPPPPRDPDDDRGKPPPVYEW